MTHPSGIIMPLSPSGVPFPWAARQAAEGVAARREAPAEVKQLTYSLEAYGPDKSTEFSLESATPFMAISAGDVLDLSWLNADKTSDGHSSGFIRVVQVDHVFWNDPTGFGHKIILFTEPTKSPWDVLRGQG